MNKDLSVMSDVFDTLDGRKFDTLGGTRKLNWSNNKAV